MGDKRGRKAKGHKTQPKTAPQRAPLPPLDIVPGQKYRADFQRLVEAGRDMLKLKAVIDLLAARKPLPAAREDHALKGKLVGYRDCHIEGDWVLIYMRTSTELRLYRTGTHSQLDI